MANLNEAIRSVLIPLGSTCLVLPNAAVAEIVGHRQPAPIADTPEWLLGTLDWRGYRVPLVSLQDLWEGTPAAVTRSSRVVVCNTISGSGQLPFIALLGAEIPRLIRIDGDSLAGGHGDAEDRPGVLRQVELYGQQAVIPDLDDLETMCLELLGEALPEAESEDIAAV